MNGAWQGDLIVTPHGDPPVLVEDLEMAPFLYMLLKSLEVFPLADRVETLTGLHFAPENPGKDEVEKGGRS